MAKTNYELENKELRQQLEEANARIAQLEGHPTRKHPHDPVLEKLKDVKQNVLDTGKHHA